MRCNYSVSLGRVKWSNRFVRSELYVRRSGLQLAVETDRNPTAAKMSMLIVRPSQFGTRTRNWLTKRASAAADPNRTSATGSFAVG